MDEVAPLIFILFFGLMACLKLGVSMAGDELSVLFVALFLAYAVWRKWYSRLFRVFAPGCPAWHRGLLAIIPPLCVVTLAWSVRRFDSPEVRESVGYIFLFSAVGAVTLGLALPLLNVLGFDVLGQAVAQGNAAALPPIVGAWLASTALNIGANTGEGATIYTALGPLAVAGVLLAVFAFAAAALTGATHSITSGRESAAGIRFGALLLAASLPLARAAAGDWVSIGACGRKFALAAPVLLILLALGWLAERIMAGRRGWLQAGVLPAAAFLIVADAFRTVPSHRR